MKIKISANKIAQLKRSNLSEFPKYSTSLINHASQTAQSTRPAVVGQLSEVYPEYEKYCENNNIIPTLEGWKVYHQNKFPNAVNESIKKTLEMLNNFRESLNNIDEDLVKKWVEDLLYDKTFYGFNIEATIKLYLRDRGLNVKDSEPSDESKNIDLYVNGLPYQVKPFSIDYKQSIKSTIDIPIIYYLKDGNAIIIEFTDSNLERLLR